MIATQIPNSGVVLEEFARLACPDEYRAWLTTKQEADRAAAGPKIIGPGAPVFDPAAAAQRARLELITAVGNAFRDGRYRLAGIPSGAHAPIDIVPDLLAGVRVKDLKRSIVSARGRAFDCVRVFDSESQPSRNAEPTIVTAQVLPRHFTPSEQVIHKAVTALWPEGMPLGLQAQQRNSQIIDFFRKETGRPVDERTIKRYFKKIKAPVPKRPKLSLVAP